MAPPRAQAVPATALSPRIQGLGSRAWPPRAQGLGSRVWPPRAQAVPAAAFSALAASRKGCSSEASKILCWTCRYRGGTGW